MDLKGSDANVLSQRSLLRKKTGELAHLHPAPLIKVTLACDGG